MPVPLKNVSAEAIEIALEKVFAEMHGKPVSVKIAELKFDPRQGRTDVALSVWDDTTDDLFTGF
ncbi:hypothetical protein FSY59_24830 [Comamonas sp. Z3]|uniref:hypothetical protein n=1 Tax=Comamonas sp. Z3 TaxID=2601247 RepID=UPI0011E8862B|nr:hypothetical protein [Comamonas sp. Z3]TYK67846.1 hypothetical protein FSY59_24830 [Comamonas sp. Z3]